MAESMTSALEKNCRRHGIRLFDLQSGAQGIVHVIGPELGLTQPGMTICCGDSHTSTHGAFGALAFGIGTSQVRDVLASQTLAMSPLKVRRIEVHGRLAPGVYAKDIILTIIGRLGMNGGQRVRLRVRGRRDCTAVDGRADDDLQHVHRGRRAHRLRQSRTRRRSSSCAAGRFAPQGEAFDRARAWWRTLASDPDARWDDEVRIDAAGIAPTVTWGINPGQSVAVDARLPRPGDLRRRPSGRVSARRSTSWDSTAASRLPARASTSRSSGRARTRGCRTCARRRGS